MTARHENGTVTRLHMGSSVCTPRSHGTTVAELVVSVAAFVALAALLLPTLSDARRQGKAVHCLANMERLGAASAIYANVDASENAIPVHPLWGLVPGALGAYEWGGKAGRGEPQTSAGPLASKWGTAEGRGPATRGLNKILYRKTLPDYQDDPGPEQVNWLQDATLDLDEFRCPADSGYTGHNTVAWRNSKLTSFDHYGTSYVANTSWVGIPGGNCKLFSNSPFLRPVSRIPNPSQTVLMQENCGRYAWRVNYGGPFDGGCGSLSGDLGSDVEQTIMGWHGRSWMFQTAFVDGHAREVRMFGHSQPEPVLGRYPPSEGIALANHGSWHCVILRGPGWQLDTLPAPPVRTSIDCVQSGGVVNGIS